MTQLIDFSKDGGATWLRVANFTDITGPSGPHTPLQAYDGVDTYVIMCGHTVAATHNGIFKSTNDGVSFNRVTGITGIDFDNDGTFVKCEYGLSKLWLAGPQAFGDGAKIWSSTDDGSTWSTELDTSIASANTITFAISGSGILYLDYDNGGPEGNFDADGVSLTAASADFTGLGVTWLPYGFSPEFLWADPNSFKPNRFFVSMYNATLDVGRVYYTDDNGTTWVPASYPNRSGASSTTAVDTHFMWDGTNYHWITTGATDHWHWSRDGSFWTPVPWDITDFALDNPERHLATALKP